jgi:EmrB/QacA subfamily drug resistance transporter
MSNRSKLVPLIVASPLFLQNIDNSAMVIALPSIAATLHVPLLQLNLVITAYLVSLAVFLPLSAWLADRFGAKKIFCSAVALYSLASALCGMADSMTTLILCRVLQGLGGAMMLPVGRLILLRAVPKTELVNAMVWYTTPPLIGRLSGPLIGGAIVSFTSWHWIFFVNIPFGVLAVGLALLFVEDSTEHVVVPPFDVKGFALMAVGLAMVLAALQTVGRGLVPGWLPAVAAAVGTVALTWYAVSSRRAADPIIDLTILRFPTLRTNVIGAAPFRLGLSAIPFLLPLSLQLGFGLSPLVTGSIVVASACGALFTRVIMRRTIRRFGFRPLLIGASLVTGLFYMSYSLFTPTTPHAVMFSMIFGCGLLSSLCMVLLNTLGYTEVPKERASHATALTTMAQQLMASSGIVLATSLLAFFSWTHGGDSNHLKTADFAASFLVVGVIAMLSVLAFRRLDANEGDALR